MIGLIWAQSSNGVIGCQGKLPWNVPEDLARFKKITAGHPVIMGRKTWDSLGHALPHRTNIVISSLLERKTPQARACLDASEARDVDIVIARSLEEALDHAGIAAGHEEVWVIGGGGIFARALELADAACITYVKGEYQGDVFAPRLVVGQRWKIKRQKPGDDSWKQSVKGPEYRFVDYVRQ